MQTSLMLCPWGKIVLICIYMYLCQHRADATLKYVNGSCNGDSGNYTQGSIYQHNLNLLLSNLTSKASIVKFQSFISGEIPNKIYGLFLCREDLSLDNCKSCIQEATRRVTQVCLFYSEAIVWYEECMVRYANRSIFSIYEWSPSYDFRSLVKVSNYREFAPLWDITMNGLMNDTASSRAYFATRETNISRDAFYFLAQCTPDIGYDGCKTCLEEALIELRSCCNASVSANLFLPSCSLRYSIHPFYNGTYQREADHISTMHNSRRKMKSSVIAGIVVGTSVGFAILIASLCSVKSICKRRGRKMFMATPLELQSEADRCEGGESLGDADYVLFNLATLRVATAEFSAENKLGEGGFGVVLKGTLESGQEIAVKRLSANSRQGATEFMNEARLVAKLQHRNLVKLVGFCSEGDEKLLVYEFMPNTSLDHVLFEPTKKHLLEWNTRHKIIKGIARGLQYLHEDSRLTIIHRDLKAANILLDGDMNPKIADFGTAKLFGDEKKHGNTNRIVGTHGYMAPEYLYAGEYSEKSDVYSFGIIILEIVSGHRCREFFQSAQQEYLTTHAWRLWNEGRSFELMDIALNYNCSRNEVIRCIQIGLLCIQANPARRPSMGIVVLMLTGSLALPLPSPPIMGGNDSVGERKHNETDRSTTRSTTSSYTEVEQDLYVD